MPFPKIPIIIAFSLIPFTVSSAKAANELQITNGSNGTASDTAAKDLVPASSLVRKEAATLSTTTSPAASVTPSTPATTSDSSGKNQTSVSAATISPVTAVPNSGEKKDGVSAETATDVDFGPYMAALQKEIKGAWHPPKGDETKRVVVVFQVDRSGHMKKLRLVTSSLIVRADQAAMAAVKHAAPFQPLPNGAPETVDVQFTFDYNVWKDGIKSADWYDHYSVRPDVASWAGRAAKTASTVIGPALDTLSLTEAFVATLKCKVRSDGTCTDWSIHTSSGNPASDTKVLDYAKDKCKTVDVPPQGLPADETINLGVGISRKP